MEKVSLSLFKRVQVELDGRPISGFRTQKVLALLVILAADPDVPQRREALMTLLWPGMPDPSARANLRQILFLLRQAIPDFEENGETIPLFIANRETIQLNAQAGVESDNCKFEGLLSKVQAHDHVALTTCSTCRENLNAAVALYQGDFLADFYLDDSNEFEEWAEINRQSYRRKALDALETLARIAARQKEYPAARSYCERQLEIDNLRESAYRQLMEVLALSGQRGEALALYETCRRLFMEELGMSPSSRMTELYENIRLGDLHFDLPHTHGVRGYELKEEIGSGAYGTIHRAIQPTIAREVAIKIIHRRYANNPVFIRRFEAEAQTIARLEHPHIVPLYDYWRESDGAYLVMRLLRGGNLLTALESGPWSLAQTLTLLEQIAPALEAAHRQGVVHRDIKPANILFDEAGLAYLSDFGIAKDLNTERQLTAEGNLLGTPDYTSPEQMQNGEISPQTDIYSLGAVLYEMLTGEKPFPNVPLVTLIQKHLSEPLPLVSNSRPDLPAQIDDAIQKATAKQPADRFSNVLELVEAFHFAIQENLPEHPGRIAAGIPLPNPYKGLRPYQEADANDFFGRESLVNTLIHRVSAARFLAVVGPSGIGKSSVVKAGLLPALRQGAIPGSENWYIAEMVPGAHPFEELEQALSSVAVNPPASLIEPMEKDARGLLRTIRRILPAEEGVQLVLIIDQFEELFTLVENEDRRKHFLESLLVAVSAPRTPLRVIVTLRADFYDRPLQYQPLAAWFKQHTELVLPLTRDELMWAIQEPAQRLGVRLEDGLVAEIIADVNEQPGALPLMQYALTETFAARRSGWMTRQAYTIIGGVLGAMTRRADEIYRGLSPDEQELVRQIFLRLVTVGEGTEDARRRVRLAELHEIAVELELADGRVSALLEIFGAARLLTFDRDPATREPTVEVAHEALLRRWDGLQRWLNEYRDDIRLQRQLASAAADWEAAGRDEGFLLHGAKLSQYEAWQQEAKLPLMVHERTFLETSLSYQRTKEKEEADRRRRELETAQHLAALERQRAQEQAHAASRLRRRAWWLAGALAIASVLAVLTLFAGRQALKNEEIAERSALVSQSLALASGAQAARADDNHDLALALALAANEIEQPPAFVERTLYEIAMAPGTVRQIVGGGGWRWAMDAHPGNRIAASGADDMIVILWDYTTGEEIMRLEGEHSDSIGGVRFTPDGRFLLSGAYDDWMILWDIQSGNPVRRMLNPTGDVNGLDISPDGRLAVAGTEYGIATLWDLETGDQVGALTHNPELQILPVAFGPDGRLVATGAEDGTIIIWDVAKQTPVHRLDGIESGGVVFGLDFSPDGQLLAVAGQSDAIRLFDVRTGEQVGVLPGHPDWVFDVDFSPDGSQLVVGTRDGAVMLWQVADQQVLRTLYAKDGRTLNVAFVDALTVISSASTGNLRVWTMADSRLSRSLRAEDFLVSMAQDADRNQVALGFDGKIRLMNLETGELARQIEAGEGSVTALAFSPDGTLLLSAQQGGAPLSPVIGLSLWDVRTGDEIRQFVGHTQRVHRLAFSPDGSSFLSASDDKQVMLWDAATGDILFRTINPDDTGNAVVFSPDGAQFAAGFGTFRFVAQGNYLDNSIRLWDTTTGEEVARLEGHTDAVVSLAYDPTGRYLLSGSIDTSLRLWELSSGKMIRRFVGHSSGVMSMAFSPDGRFAVSGSQDGTLIVWEVETGELIRQIRGHEGVVHFVGFTPDGEHIWSAAEDGGVNLWRPFLSPGTLDTWIVNNRYIPTLPCDQRLLYGLVTSCEQ